jgi:hypothetical protein
MARNPNVSIAVFERHPVPVGPRTVVIVIAVHPRMFFVNVRSVITVGVRAVIGAVPANVHMFFRLLPFRLPIACDVNAFVIHVRINPHEAFTGGLTVEAFDHLFRFVQVSGHPNPTVFIHLNGLLRLSYLHTGEGASHK